MRYYLSIIVVFFAFSVYLTHDALPHLHLDDHAHHDSEKQEPADETGHLVLTHHIDDTFTFNKVIKIKDLSVTASDLYLSGLQKINIPKEQFHFSDHTEKYKSQLIPKISGNRAPPCI